LVTDVLPARIRTCAARPGLAKCGWWRCENEQSDWPSRPNPEGANSAHSSYRLLGDVVLL